MSTLTPFHHASPAVARVVPQAARWAYHAVQTIWLVAMVVTAIGAGHTLGYIVLWALGAGIIATIDFVYLEYKLHDHPSNGA